MRTEFCGVVAPARRPWEQLLAEELEPLRVRRSSRAAHKDAVDHARRLGYLVATMDVDGNIDVKDGASLHREEVWALRERIYSLWSSVRLGKQPGRMSIRRAYGWCVDLVFETWRKPVGISVPMNAKLVGIVRSSAVPFPSCKLVFVVRYGGPCERDEIYPVSSVTRWFALVQQGADVDPCGFENPDYHWVGTPEGFWYSGAPVHLFEVFDFSRPPLTQGI